MPSARFQVPANLRRLASEPHGNAWLERLPLLAAECADAWSLTLEPPTLPSNHALVLPVTRADGTPAILKLRPPPAPGERDDAADEALALVSLAGSGSILLLAFDPRRHALLLERCIPGIPLAQTPEQALDVLVRLLPRQWQRPGPTEPPTPSTPPASPTPPVSPAPPASPTPRTSAAPTRGQFLSLADQAVRWRESLPGLWQSAGRPFERRLLDTAIQCLAQLPPSQREHILINEDIHGDNILEAQREPWLAIDPAPLIGEREFTLASIIRCPEFGHSRPQVLHRFHRLTSDLSLDPQRTRDWAIAHAIVRAFLGNPIKPHCVEVARWLLKST